MSSDGTFHVKRGFEQEDIRAAALIVSKVVRPEELIAIFLLVKQSPSDLMHDMLIEWSQVNLPSKTTLTRHFTKLIS